MTRVLYRELATWLLPTALATDHGPTLVTILLEELRARRIVCQPLAAQWGSGTTSSSDAQFFHAGARGEVGGLANLHYGLDPRVKFYTHLSDQFGPFHTKVIAATANEAPYVLDGLLYLLRRRRAR